MDVYYRKLMGNGSVASKFKLDTRTYPESPKNTDENEPKDALSHASCARCHRMKMRCSRTLPQCENCLKRQVPCEYTAREGERPPELGLPSVSVSVTGSASGSHHSSCVRCYKSKKKCSRTFPVCDSCQKASTECQYVERRRKKPKTEENGVEADGRDVDGRDADGRDINRRDVEGRDINRRDVEGRDINRRDIDENIESKKEDNGAGAFAGGVFRNIDLPVQAERPENRSENRPERSASERPGSSAPQKVCTVSQKVVSAPRNGNIEEEFLVVRPIEDGSLPSLFVHTFFANYEWRYPFLSREQYVQKLQEVSFENETFVQLDIYLILATGCLIYDSNYNTRHYAAYFSDSLIESMVDIISYDIKSDEDLHKAHLLILLSIYAINVCNLNLLWNIVGFLNRLVVFMTDFSGGSTCMRKRCFWTIFNLDKELSLVLNKLSQFIPTTIIRLDSDFSQTLHAGEPPSLGMLMAGAVSFHKLQDRMLSLKMGLVERNPELLTQFSADLEAWRVSFSSLLHKEYSELVVLPKFIGLVNLDYYYLLIEMDQLSSTESHQFTLQFLSNSFSLLLSESEQKHAGATCTYSLFWFVKFFKVIDYSVESLPRILCPDLSKADLSLRLNEFHSNLQLIVNLLKFLLNSDKKPQRFVHRLETYVQKLKVISSRLSAVNPLVAGGDVIEALGTDLVQEFMQETA